MCGVFANLKVASCTVASGMLERLENIVQLDETVLLAGCVPQTTDW